AGCRCVTPGGPLCRGRGRTHLPQPNIVGGCMGSIAKAAVCFEPTGDTIYVYDRDTASAPVEELQHLAAGTVPVGTTAGHACT
ncbi:hypothetical protein, partial [Streptomyces sp. NPDC096934]|uniref:hypothetical protein n=1 Tax=Streptomyces sp. NPDC096934 TaxID=3155551 RepID=UPI003322BE01